MSSSNTVWDYRTTNHFPFIALAAFTAQSSQQRSQHLPIKSAHIIVGVNTIHDEPSCSGVSFDQADADPGVMGSAITVSPRQSHDCHGAQVKW